jgi:hypothetical protein
MRIKIGGVWYTSDEFPLAVVFDDDDKEVLREMLASKNGCYLFQKVSTMTETQCNNFMADVGKYNHAEQNGSDDEAQAI